MYILLIVIFVLLLWITVFRHRRRRMYQLAALLPKPSNELPVIGNAHSLIGNTEDIMSALQQFSYESMINNGIQRFWLNHILYLVMVNPVDSEMVLKTCLEKDDLHRFMRYFIGNGIIFAPGYFLTYIVPIWRRRRRILVPAFSPKVIETFVAVFSKQSEKLSQNLATKVNKKFSIWHLISSYSLESVLETSMGVKINTQGNQNSAFLNAVNTGMNLVIKRIFHVWLHPDWLYKLLPQSYQQENCKKVVHDFTDMIIKQKRDEIKKQKPSNETGTNRNLGLAYQEKTFLDLLITLSGGEEGYNDVELREEILTLSIAGTDTSAATIGSALMLLGKYPKVQETLFNELLDVFGDSDRPIEKDDFSKLKYLDRVIKETLRLYPPGPIIVRKVTEEIKLPSSGYTLPAGSGIILSIWGAHRDPRYWGPDAEAFDPDRFLPERFNLKHACSYMPFSSGPRNCVGYQYAMLSIKAALTAILRRYKVVDEEEISPAPRIRVKLEILLKAVDGYQVTLERRYQDKHYKKIDKGY